MRTIKVNNCEVCPFRATEYDDYAVGYDSIDTCLLAPRFNINKNVINVYKMSSKYDCDCGNRDTCECDDKLPNTPTWCPLLESKISVSYE